MNINNRGFGLIEVLVASAILSAIILGLSKQSKIITTVNNKMKTQDYSISLQKQLSSILAEERNCSANFDFFDDKIKLKDNKNIFYYNNTDLIPFIDIAKEDDSKSVRKIMSIDVIKGRYGLHDLVVNLALKNKKGHFSLVKPIKVPILVRYDDGWSCSTASLNQIDGLINTAVLKSCKTPFRIIETKSKTLMYKCILPIGELHSSDCPAGEKMEKIILKNENSKLTINTICKKISPCSDGEFGVWFNEKIVCRPKCKNGEVPILTRNGIACSKSTCKNGEYLKGYSGDGNPICHILVDSSKKSCSKKLRIIGNDNKVALECD